MSVITRQLKWAYQFFGVSSVYETGLDSWLIILSRTSRMLAYGATSLIIALFFSALKFTDIQIGLFMTLTLLGDVILSGFLSLAADALGRRRVLLCGSVLMILSGLIFTYFENFWILLLAAVIGIISATGGDFGPFRAIEESMLSQLSTSKTRADVLAWYTSLTSIGKAVSTEVGGRFIESLSKRAGWTDVDAYHAAFWGYAIFGSINLICTLSLSKKCELEAAPEEKISEEEAGVLMSDFVQDEDSDDDHPSRNLQQEINTGVKSTTEARKGSLFAQISQKTRVIMYKLWFLLMVDSVADGMANYSLTSYFFDQKFHVQKSTLGDILSISYFLSAASTIFAGPLCRMLGLVNTMVFTHLPSSAAVLLFPAPSSLWLTVILFFIRTGLNNMDQAPRSAFIAAVVQPSERTAVMGITSLLRTLAATCGPTITGWLSQNGRFWIAFVVAGTMRILYDFGLYAMFKNMNIPDQPTPKAKASDGEDLDGNGRVRGSEQ